MADLCCQPWLPSPDICPDPCAIVCNEPCITSCADSNAVVYAPPVVVRFPGPILATSSQDSLMGTTLPNFLYRSGGGGFSGSAGGLGGISSGRFVGGFSGAYGGGFSSGYGGGYWGSFGGSRRYGRRCCYTWKSPYCRPC